MTLQLRSVPLGFLDKADARVGALSLGIEGTEGGGDRHRTIISDGVDRSAVEVATDDQAIASSVLDAGTTERTMLIAEVYRRHGVWRLRAVGQGYDHGLAELAARYGVAVD